MTPTAYPHLHGFVGRAHRRSVAIHFAEGAGIGMLGASAIALTWATLLAVRGQPALLAASAVLAGGVVAGIVLAFSSRPSKLGAAAIADRQLDLDDLLSTAVSIERNIRGNSGGGVTRDPWQQAVLARAEVRCAQLSECNLSLGRLGRRAWAAIALAAMLVLSLALLTDASSPGGAGVARRTRLPTAGDPAGRNTEPVLALLPQQKMFVPGEAPDESAQHPGAAATQNGSTDTAAAQPSRAASANASSPDGGGAGSARTPGSHPLPSQTPQAGHSVPEPSVGRGAGGAGEEAPAAAAADGSGGGQSSAARRSAAAPPWQSPTWPAQVGAARESVAKGRSPEACRDLILRYFDRAR